MHGVEEYSDELTKVDLRSSGGLISQVAVLRGAWGCVPKRPANVRFDLARADVAPFCQKAKEIHIF